MRRALVLVVALAAGVWIASCQSGDRTGPPPPSPSPPPPPPGPPVASDPVTVTTPSAKADPSVMSPAVDIDVAYITLPPGSAPNGRVATIRNRRTLDSARVGVAEGGFDPAAIPAIAGDTIEIVVRDGNGTVVLQPPLLVVTPKRPPVVVRTNPPPRKRDVPLNARITVVFSEPIDPGTLTSSTIQLRAGSQPVAGTLAFRDSAHVTVLFVPNAPLSPATTYTLTVSSQIRDLDGDPLDEAVTVEFTTATGGGFEEYFVDAALPLSGDQLGDSVVIDYTVRVLDGTGVGIEGAVIRVRVSNGTAIPATTTSGLGGLTTGQWRFAGIIGVFPVDSTAELAACASTSATRCDQFWPILLVGYRVP